MSKYIPLIVAVALVAMLIIFRNKITDFFTKKSNTDSSNTPAANSTAPAQLDYNKTLKQGVSGAEVSKLQEWLGVSADGQFGPITRQALEDKKGVSQVTLNQYATLADAQHGGGGSWGDDDESNFTWAMPSTWFS